MQSLIATLAIRPSFPDYDKLATMIVGATAKVHLSASISISEKVQLSKYDEDGARTSGQQLRVPEHVLLDEGLAETVERIWEAALASEEDVASQCAAVVKELLCVQASSSDATSMILSIALPAPPPEAVLSGGLPFGAVEAVKNTFGLAVQLVDPPESGFHMTLKLDLSKLPPDEDDRVELMIKVACLRAIVLGAPLRDVLKHLAAKVMAPEADRLIAVMHRPRESFFVIPQPDKVTIVFPMRFKDSNDSVLATSFLHEFMEARRAGGLNTAPSCQWSPHPPIELKGAPAHALDANAGFVLFVILPRHVEGEKLDKTVWSLCTFHAYVSYHVKCSKAFMHTRMRRRVETLIQVTKFCFSLASLDCYAVLFSFVLLWIQALNRAKPEEEKEAKIMQGRSFKRLV
ncbi:hypothetical protein L7F22_010556 [Adiantum nelumboides]|nr:hypothetical protein [Adiantum nelumboides]